MKVYHYCATYSRGSVGIGSVQESISGIYETESEVFTEWDYNNILKIVLKHGNNVTITSLTLL